MLFAHAESAPVSPWVRYGPGLIALAGAVMLAVAANSHGEMHSVAGAAEGDTHCDPDDQKEGEREPHTCHCPYGCGCPKTVSLGEACVSCELGQCQRYNKD